MNNSIPLELIFDSLGEGWRIFLTQNVDQEKEQLCDFLVSSLNFVGEKPGIIPDVPSLISK